MKKFLLAVSLILGATVVTGCSNDVEVQETASTRFENVNIFNAKQLDESGDFYHTGVDIYVSALDDRANVHVLLIEEGKKAPTNEQIISGKNYDNVQVKAQFSAESELDVFASVTEIDLLKFGSTYDVYAIIESNGTYSDTMYKTTVSTDLSEELTYKGVGTETDPYRIYDLEDLEALSEGFSTGSSYRGSHFKLMSNIDMSEKYNASNPWTPIGYLTGTRQSLSGSFDGNGFTISNLYVDTKNEGAGLFAELTATGVIKNLALTNPVLKSTSSRAGTVVGYSKGTCDNIKVIGADLDSTTKRLGGIVGQLFESGTINNCYVEADIVGGESTAGIVGNVYGSKNEFQDRLVVSNCQFKGSVVGQDNVGGIIGQAEFLDGSNLIVLNSTIKGDENVGGIIGSDSTWNKFASVNFEADNLFISNSTVTSANRGGEVIGVTGNHLNSGKSEHYNWKDDSIVTNANYYNVTLNAPTKYSNYDLTHSLYTGAGTARDVALVITKLNSMPFSMNNLTLAVKEEE